MTQQTITPSGWLKATADTDISPVVRELASQVIQLMRALKLRAQASDRRLKTLTDRLGALCLCITPDGLNPQVGCPLHGDGKTFVREVRELRELRFRAKELAYRGSPAIRAAANRIMAGERK